MEETRRLIESSNRKFGEYIRKGDAKALAGLYTKDACLLPTNSEMIRGNKAVEEFWRGAITGLGLKDAVLTTQEVVGSGETVTEMGKYMLKIQPEGQALMEDRGKYLVVWKRTPEGWKLHWDIWNTSLPAG